MNIIKKINKVPVIWQILPELSVEDLENVIQVAADAYYNTATSLISDENYDILVERLRALNPKSKVLTSIGAPVKGKKVKLPFWMGSMNKIKSDEKQIKKWINTYKGPYIISDKLDGISCLLVLRKGIVKLYTRGDGENGQDISHLADMCNMSLDNLIKAKQDVVVRGELIMNEDKFKKYKQFANARNMVAGIVNSKVESVNEKHARDVDFVTYEVIEPVAKPSDQMKLLQKWGLITAYYDIYHDISLDILDSILAKRKKKSIYQIDGIIVTDNKIYPRVDFENPSFSFAYKGKTETAETTVRKVVWNPSKDGYLVPTIYYKKVHLSGVDMIKTTGFNAKYIVDNKIGIGSVITVMRSGDVIPYITGVVKPAKKVALPEDVEYFWDGTSTNIILSDIEGNSDVIIKRLTKFMHDIGVENLSQGIITKLVENGYDDIFKIISLSVDDLLELDGFQETLAKKIYNNLWESLSDLNVLDIMVASNLFGRGFGERRIKIILDNFPNIVTEYTKENRNTWKDRLMILEGFDTITVHKFLKQLPEFQIFYKKLGKVVTIKPYKKKTAKGQAFAGQTVVFTGFRNEAWKTFIENEGGKVAGSVSRNTTLLVYNNGEEGTSKYLKAKSLGVQTISKTDFAKKYNV